MTLQRERKSMRLPEYDYSMPGAYFVTTCTKRREFLFETPDARLAVESAWQSLLDIFANIELGEFVVMPNHVHCIIWIIGEGASRLHAGTWKNDFNIQRRGGQLPTPTLDNIKFETLSNIVGAFKTTAATRINKLRGIIGLPVWQKSFYDRIVRNERELERIQNISKTIPSNGQKIEIIPQAQYLDLPQNPSTIIGLKYLINPCSGRQLPAATWGICHFPLDPSPFRSYNLIIRQYQIPALTRRI